MFSASVRQNILFGAPYDEEKYLRTVKSCCLVKDFALMPQGFQFKNSNKKIPTVYAEYSMIKKITVK